MPTVRASVALVDKATVRQPFEQRYDTVLRHSEREANVLYGGQPTAVLCRQTQQIDPRAEVIARELLHLRIVNDLGIKAKPSGHF